MIKGYVDSLSERVTYYQDSLQHKNLIFSSHIYRADLTISYQSTPLIP